MFFLGLVGFTAASLLLVLAAAMLMQKVGLSMALGAFAAGVLLAESEYRRALEADLEPFKGLLLGMFFIAVGMGLDLTVLWQKPLAVLTPLIESFCPFGGVVLDPFAGSASTLVAACLCGRHGVGCELEAQMHAIAVARLARVRRLLLCSLGIEGDVAAALRLAA